MGGLGEGVLWGARASPELGSWKAHINPHEPEVKIVWYGARESFMCMS